MTEETQAQGNQGTPSPAEEARLELAAAAGEGGEPTPPEKEAPPEGEAPPSSVSDLPELTDEQLDRLASDPRLAQRVMRTDFAASTLEDFLQSALEETATKAETEKQTAERQATWNEAWKMVDESGDYSAIGKLAADQMKRQAELNAAREALAPEIEAEAFNAYDTAVLEVFGDVIETLSEEDRQALNRSNFASDTEFTSAVLRKLTDARVGKVLAERAPELSAQAQAARNAATGDKARGDAMPVLPGGSVNQGAVGDDIGSLIRAGIGPLETAYEE